MNCPIDGKPCSKYKSHTVKDSEGKSHVVCEDCVAKRGLKVESGFGACPRCGTTMEQIVKESRVGCAGCYDHFETPLSLVIASVQVGANKHVGTPPISFRRSLAGSTRPVEFATELLVKMKAAAKNGRYEEAAELRDLLKEVKKLMSRSDEMGDLAPADTDGFAEIVMRFRFPESTERL